MNTAPRAYIRAVCGENRLPVEIETLDLMFEAAAYRTVAYNDELKRNIIQPRNGIIEIRLAGAEHAGHQCEAILQAIEVGPGDGGSGATPKAIYR